MRNALVSALAIDWPTTAEVLANWAQIVALVVAGWWTYWLFVRHRHNRLRADLTHRLVELGLNGESQMLRVEVTVKNIGNVILIPPRAVVKLYQVRPVTAEILGSCAVDAAEEDRLKRPADCELRWARIAKTSVRLGVDHMSLEPGESDAIACDFAIPATVQAIFARTELYCGADDSPNRHWHHETFHELSKTRGG